MEAVFGNEPSGELERKENMAKQRVKLSKKLFMSLKPGQYLMDNYASSTYEEITYDLSSQWNNWKSKNGNIVNVYGSKEECLRDWWALHSGTKLTEKSRAKYLGKMSKKVFMDTPTGYYILFTQEPYEYFQLEEDRNKQWQDCRHNNGRMIRLFENINDCIMERNDLYATFTE